MGCVSAKSSSVTPRSISLPCDAPHMTQADYMLPIRSKPQTAETLQKRMFISYTPKVAIHVMGKLKVLYNLTAF